MVHILGWTFNKCYIYGCCKLLDYQIYAPCVHQLEWGCGGFAMQNDYKEYGEASFMNNHKHGLMNKDRGYDYVVE